MIYKDLFRITINGKEYTEGYKQFFTLKEMKNIYIENRAQNVVVVYEPLWVDEILSPEEMAGV